MNSSIESPPWWTDSLRQNCDNLVTDALPNEACGWFVMGGSGVQPMILPAQASPFRVQAHPEAVVRALYQVMHADGKIVGTFHSHPNGRRTFSQSDKGLSLYGPWHGLAVRVSTGWEWVFATSRFTPKE